MVPHMTYLVGLALLVASSVAQAGSLVLLLVSLVGI
jgi:hypothetical protein